MKKISLLIISILAIFLPLGVNAASASIGVSASNTVQVGNTITVTVTITGSEALGSWEADLTYDSNYLKMTSSSAEAGGSAMVGYVTNSSTKSKSYTFKFKALKSGSTKVSVSSAEVYAYDESSMGVSLGSKTITIQTKEEIEASYSDDASLKSLSVEGYTLSPEFKKSTYEYNLEVENEIEKVTISASKNNSSASVSGTGEQTLVEGNNTFEVVVTAQKGNTLTYKINVYRKELNPISVTINDKEYTLVRKSEDLPTYLSFTSSTITYEDTEIPVLVSDITGYTLVGVKDDDGNVYMYIYEDGNFKEKYFEVTSDAITIYPLNLPDDDLFKGFTKKNVDFNDLSIQAYVLNDKSNFAILYAQNVETGEIGYYSYNLNSKSLTEFDTELLNTYLDKINNYKYVVLGMLGFIVILLFILIMRKPKIKRNKKQEKDTQEIDNPIPEKRKKKEKLNK